MDGERCTCGAPDAYRGLGYELPLCSACWAARASRSHRTFTPIDNAGSVNVRGVAEDGKQPDGACDWEYDPPQPSPDDHHTFAIEINGGIGYQQGPPVHVRGVRPGSAGKARAIGGARVGAIDTERAIEGLTDLQSRVVRLSRTGMSAREIADAIDTTTQAVDLVLYRARKRLARMQATT